MQPMGITHVALKKLATTLRQRPRSVQFLQGRMVMMDTAFMEGRNTVENAKHHFETIDNRVFHMQSPGPQTGSEFHQGVPQPAEGPRVHRPQQPGSPTQPNVFL